MYLRKVIFFTAAASLIGCNEKSNQISCNIDNVFELTQELNEQFDRIMSLDTGDALYEQYRNAYKDAVKKSGEAIQANGNPNPAVCQSLMNLTEELKKAQ